MEQKPQGHALLFLSRDGWTNEDRRTHHRAYEVEKIVIQRVSHGWPLPEVALSVKGFCSNT